MGKSNKQDKPYTSPLTEALREKLHEMRDNMVDPLNAPEAEPYPYFDGGGPVIPVSHHWDGADDNSRYAGLMQAAEIAESWAIENEQGGYARAAWSVASRIKMVADAASEACPTCEGAAQWPDGQSCLTCGGSGIKGF